MRAGNLPSAPGWLSARYSWRLLAGEAGDLQNATGILRAEAGKCWIVKGSFSPHGRTGDHLLT